MNRITKHLESIDHSHETSWYIDYSEMGLLICYEKRPSDGEEPVILWIQENDQNARQFIQSIWEKRANQFGPTAMGDVNVSTAVKLIAVLDDQVKFQNSLMLRSWGHALGVN